MAEKVQALATASPRVRRVTSPACTQSHFPGKFTLHLNERAPSTPGLHLHRVVIFALNFASYQNREATCFYENLRLFRDPRRKLGASREQRALASRCGINLHRAFAETFRWIREYITSIFFLLISIIYSHSLSQKYSAWRIPWRCDIGIYLRDSAGLVFVLISPLRKIGKMKEATLVRIFLLGKFVYLIVVALHGD